MEEELLQSIYSEGNFENDGIDFDTFKSTMSSNEDVRKSVYDEFKLEDDGITYETFKSTLGLTEETPVKKKEQTQQEEASSLDSESTAGKSESQQEEQLTNQELVQNVPGLSLDQTGSRMAQPVEPEVTGNVKPDLGWVEEQTQEPIQEEQPSVIDVNKKKEIAKQEALRQMNQVDSEKPVVGETLEERKRQAANLAQEQRVAQQRSVKPELQIEESETFELDERGESIAKEKIPGYINETYNDKIKSILPDIPEIESIMIPEEDLVEQLYDAYTSEDVSLKNYEFKNELRKKVSQERNNIFNDKALNIYKQTYNNYLDEELNQPNASFKRAEELAQLDVVEDVYRGVQGILGLTEKESKIVNDYYQLLRKYRSGTETKEERKLLIDMKSQMDKIRENARTITIIDPSGNKQVIKNNYEGEIPKDKPTLEKEIIKTFYKLQYLRNQSDIDKIAKDVKALRDARGLLGTLMTDQEPALRAQAIETNKTVAKLNALAEAYFLNKNPIEIKEDSDLSSDFVSGLYDFVKGTGEGLLDAFTETINSPTVPTREDIQESAVIALPEAGIELTKEDIDNAYRSKANEVGIMIGESLQIGTEIGLHTLTLNELGLLRSAKSVAKIFNVAKGTKKYKVLEALVSQARSGVAFEMADVGATTGAVEEGSEQLFSQAVKLLPSKFKALNNMLTRRLIGATGVTFSEITGDLANTVVNSGYNLDDAFKEVVGETREDQYDTLLSLGIMGITMGGGKAVGNMKTTKSKADIIKQLAGMRELAQTDAQKAKFEKVREYAGVSEEQLDNYKSKIQNAESIEEAEKQIEQDIESQEETDLTEEGTTEEVQQPAAKMEEEVETTDAQLDEDVDADILSELEEVDEFVQEEEQEIVNDNMGEKVVYQGEEGVLSKDGQSLVVLTNEGNKINELGNFEELKDKPLSSMNVSLGDKFGDVVVKGKEFVIKDKNGVESKVVSVKKNKKGEYVAKLKETESGLIRRRVGEEAENIYNEFNQFKRDKNIKPSKEAVTQETFNELPKQEKEKIVSDQDKEIEELIKKEEAENKKLAKKKEQEKKIESKLDKEAKKIDKEAKELETEILGDVEEEVKSTKEKGLVLSDKTGDYLVRQKPNGDYTVRKKNPETGKYTSVSGKTNEKKRKEIIQEFNKKIDSVEEQRLKEAEGLFEEIAKEKEDKIEKALNAIIDAIDPLKADSGTLMSSISAIPQHMIAGSLKIVRGTYKTTKNLTIAIQKGIEYLRDKGYDVNETEYKKVLSQELKSKSKVKAEPKKETKSETKKDSDKDSTKGKPKTKTEGEKKPTKSQEQNIKSKLESEFKRGGKFSVEKIKEAIRKTKDSPVLSQRQISAIVNKANDLFKRKRVDVDGKKVLEPYNQKAREKEFNEFVDKVLSDAEFVQELTIAEEGARKIKGKKVKGRSSLESIAKALTDVKMSVMDKGTLKEVNRLFPSIYSALKGESVPTKQEANEYKDLVKRMFDRQAAYEAQLENELLSEATIQTTGLTADELAALTDQAGDPLQIITDPEKLKKQKAQSGGNKLNQALFKAYERMQDVLNEEGTKLEDWAFITKDQLANLSLNDKKSFIQAVIEMSAFGGDRGVERIKAILKGDIKATELANDSSRSVQPGFKDTLARMYESFVDQLSDITVVIDTIMKSEKKHRAIIESLFGSFDSNYQTTLQNQAKYSEKNAKRFEGMKVDEANQSSVNIGIASFFKQHAEGLTAEEIQQDLESKKTAFRNMIRVLRQTVATTGDKTFEQSVAEERVIKKDITKERVKNVELQKEKTDIKKKKKEAESDINKFYQNEITNLKSKRDYEIDKAKSNSEKEVIKNKYNGTKSKPGLIQEKRKERDARLADLEQGYDAQLENVEKEIEESNVKVAELKAKEVALERIINTPENVDVLKETLESYEKFEPKLTEIKSKADIEKVLTDKERKILKDYEKDFADIFPSLNENNRKFNGKELIKNENYTPLFAMNINNLRSSTFDVTESGSSGFNDVGMRATQTGSKIERVPVDVSGETIYDFNIRKIAPQRMHEMEYDINTLGDRISLVSAANSKDFSKIFGGDAKRTNMVKDGIKRLLNNREARIVSDLSSKMGKKERIEQTGWNILRRVKYETLNHHGQIAQQTAPILIHTSFVAPKGAVKASKYIPDLITNREKTKELLSLGNVSIRALEGEYDYKDMKPLIDHVIKKGQVNGTEISRFLDKNKAINEPLKFADELASAQSWMALAYKNARKYIPDAYDLSPNELAAQIKRLPEVTKNEVINVTNEESNKINNQSDPSKRGKLYSETDIYGKYMKEFFLNFASFPINQKIADYNNWRRATAELSTKQILTGRVPKEKLKELKDAALFTMGRYSGNLAFVGMKQFLIAPAAYYLVDAFTGLDGDDDDKSIYSIFAENTLDFLTGGIPIAGGFGEMFASQVDKGIRGEDAVEKDKVFYAPNNVGELMGDFGSIGMVGEITWDFTEAFAETLSKPKTTEELQKKRDKKLENVLEMVTPLTYFFGIADALYMVEKTKSAAKKEKNKKKGSGGGGVKIN